MPHLDRAERGLAQEDDPEVLAAYARGLWQQWQALSGAGGKPHARYNKTVVKAAMVWLTQCYFEAGAPIPYELARLVRATISPDKKASTSPVRAASEVAYWAAIEFEAADPDATQYAVAKHLRETGKLPTASSQKSAEATVRGWRRLTHFKDNVNLFRSKRELE